MLGLELGSPTGAESIKTDSLSLRARRQQSSTHTSVCWCASILVNMSPGGNIRATSRILYFHLRAYPSAFL